MKQTRILRVRPQFYKGDLNHNIRNFQDWFSDVEIKIEGIWQDGEGIDIFASEGIKAEFDIDTATLTAIIDGELMEVFPCKEKLIKGYPISVSQISFTGEFITDKLTI